MLTDFIANADIHGQRVDLSWLWSGKEQRPGMCLVRRQRAFPISIDDGLRVLDLAELQMITTGDWGQVERVSYLGANMDVNSGLYLARINTYFDNSDPTMVHPKKINFDYYDQASKQFNVIELLELLRFETSTNVSLPWKKVLTHRIYATPGGGTEQLLGSFIIYSDHQDSVTKNRLEWHPQVGLTVTVEFDSDINQMMTVNMETTEDRDSSVWRYKVSLTDTGLIPEEINYYRLFISDPATPIDFKSEINWRIKSVPSRRYGLDDKLYKLLPSLHQYYDESDPSQTGKGQLRNYISIFGNALDQVRSHATALSSRQDILHDHSDRLPLLSRWLGWELDTTQHEINQRNDILLAPEVYRSLGSVPNIRALVNHITGWDCKVKEFVHNVFLTNAPEKIFLSELWERHFTGDPANDNELVDEKKWSTPKALTRTEKFDGHPVAGFVNNNVEWLFWHADRRGYREIWYQRQDGVDAEPRPAMHDLPEDANIRFKHNIIDENPTTVTIYSRVLLFWNSNRNGNNDIWYREYVDNLASAPTQLTAHKAIDQQPTAAYHDGDSETLWLFWESNRRGPTDIWMMKYNATTMMSYDEINKAPIPKQITTAEFHHHNPSVAIDGTGRLWLVWSDVRGDRCNLYVKTLDPNTDTWSEPHAITLGQQRDQSPATVWWNNQLWIVWHTNKNKHWCIVAQPWSWTLADDKPDSNIDPIILTHDVSGDKEPSVVINSNDELQIYWRSKHRGQSYQSRTFDTNDPELKGRLGTFHDRAHYTYDTGKTHEDKFARDTIGIYLTPDTDQADQINRHRRLVEGPLKNFLPVNVRAELFIMPSIYKEYIYTAERDINEFFERETTTVSTEVYSGLDDSYEDTLPQWIWLRAWSELYPDHLTVNTVAAPVDTRHRIWHTGISNEV